MSERGKNLGPPDKACAACPWRVDNRGRRTPGGWYKVSNLRRLWSGIRTGEAPGMTCHPTDPEMRDADGADPNRFPDDGSDFHECRGYHVLVMRELRILQDVDVDLKRYRELARSPAMTREGLLVYSVRPYPPVMGGVGQPHPEVSIEELDDLSIDRP